MRLQAEAVPSTGGMRWAVLAAVLVALAATCGTKREREGEKIPDWKWMKLFNPVSS